VIQASKLPYGRLSTFYLFYFASVGAFIPYWSLYLQGRGFSVSQIAELLAVGMATRIVAPNVWGWIADHSASRMRVVRAAGLLAAILFAGVLLNDSYVWLLLVIAAYSFFWYASLPQFEATVLGHLGLDTHRYSAIRLWGSIGFILAVAGIGVVLDNYGSDQLPPFILLFLVGAWAVSLFTPDSPKPPAQVNAPSLSTVLRQPAVLALLTICFLMQASHGVYYGFFTLFLESHGYSRTLVGQLWALGVIAEIGIFVVMHRLLPRFGVRRLLLVTLMLAAARWLLIGLGVESIAIVLFAQLLHAFTFGVFHSATISVVHRIFPGQLQGRGQALYSSLGYGAGGAVGTLASGYIWSSVGAVYAFVFAAVLCLAAWLVAFRWGRFE